MLNNCVHIFPIVPTCVRFCPLLTENYSLFLAVQNSSIGDLLVTHSVTVLLLLTYKERPQRLVTFETFDQIDEESPLRHLIKVMRRHDLTKKFYLPTYLPVHLP